MLLIVDGLKAIKNYQNEFKLLTREYKKLFRGWGYTYKAIYPKNAKKPYYYWYKWEYNADIKNNVWTYIGKNKPEGIDIPNPPENILDYITYEIAGNNVLINEEMYEQFKDLFAGFQTFKVQT